MLFRGPRLQDCLLLELTPRHRFKSVPRSHSSFLTSGRSRAAFTSQHVSSARSRYTIRRSPNRPSYPFFRPPNPPEDISVTSHSKSFSSTSHRPRPLEPFTTPRCPSPTCPCAETPDLPPDKPIDKTSSLTNTIPNYDTHAVIYTGKSDWASKIEFDNPEPGGKNIAAELKGELAAWKKQADRQSRGGGLRGLLGSSKTSTPDIKDPGVMMISNSSFFNPNTRHRTPNLEHYRRPRLEQKVANIAKEKGLAEPIELALFPNPRRITLLELDFQIPYLTSWPGPTSDFHPRVSAPDVAEGKPVRCVIRDITSVTILICSHGGRDIRCGILGPLLKEEFERQLQRLEVRTVKEPEVFEDPLEAARSYQMAQKEEAERWGVGHAVETESRYNGELGAEESQHRDKAVGEQKLGDINELGKSSGISASVGLVSHIGGHKWAGNVIIYFPSSYFLLDATDSAGKMDAERHQLGALAGKGVWYGRVEPKHVEGLVTETILKGRVVEELCRGVTS